MYLDIEQLFPCIHAAQVYAYLLIGLIYLMGLTSMSVYIGFQSLCRHGSHASPLIIIPSHRRSFLFSRFNAFLLRTAPSAKRKKIGQTNAEGGPEVGGGGEWILSGRHGQGAPLPPYCSLLWGYSAETRGLVTHPARRQATAPRSHTSEKRVRP